MKGVIFDFNGTLLLDDEINKIAWKTYAKEKLNIIMTDEDYYKYNGTPGENWIVGLTKGQITGEDAVKHRIGKEGQYRKELKDANIDLIKGAKDFFEKLKEANIPFTIATSSDGPNVQLYFEKFNLNKWFDLSKCVYTDGTFKGKPNPDIYLKAAEKIGVDIKDCVVFEDTKSGAQAGFNAGAKVIGMTAGKSAEEVMKFGTVIDVINDFTEITIEKLNKLFN